MIESTTVAGLPTSASPAEQQAAALFENAGWEVVREAAASSSSGMVFRRSEISYAVRVKSGSEGRGDRLIPLWSQACLQAKRAAGGHQTPLAIVAAPQVSPRVAEQVLAFAAEYAPEAGAGVMDSAGLRMFQGPFLDDLNAEARDPGALRAGGREPANIFSDLNQWMLKVLLAPELPETMLSAPRSHYRSASDLARAANVSVMSATRLVRQLREEGYLDASPRHLELVRREDLFRRWQASTMRPVKEVPSRFLSRGDPAAQLRRLVDGGRACLGLFAAADALGLGFVDGVPPHLYADGSRASADPAAWRQLIPVPPGQVPDLIVRVAPTPNAIFNAMVASETLPACDVLQVWLDVSSHPARGAEQAELIGRTVLDPVIHRDGPG